MLGYILRACNFLTLLHDVYMGGYIRNILGGVPWFSFLSILSISGGWVGAWGFLSHYIKEDWVWFGAGTYIHKYTLDAKNK